MTLRQVCHKFIYATQPPELYIIVHHNGLNVNSPLDA